MIGLHCGFTLLCLSYYKAINTSPGVADKNYIPLEATEAELAEAKEEATVSISPEAKKDKYKNLESFYKPRWCSACKAWKPPRAHHCREWNMCVLKLDHYCPWVYNCVGYRNHKFFALFLAYSSICLTYFLICCVVRFVYIVRESPTPPGQLPMSITEGILFILQMVLTLPVTIGIVSLFSFQMSCLHSNMTSIESYAYRNYRKGLKTAGIRFRWFYDFGPSHNYKQVFGTGIREWIFPVMPESTRTGDGCTYRTRVFSLKDVRRDGPDDGNDVVSNGIQKRQNNKKKGHCRRRASYTLMKIIKIITGNTRYELVGL